MRFSLTILSAAALTSVALGDLQGKSFRILPLGASITKGDGSKEGNGYREALRQDLQKGNTTVEFIGSQKSGNMKNNRHEGHPGYVISQVLDASKKSIGLHPNVILLFAGSNNMKKDADAAKAPTDMAKTLNSLISSAPDAVILVSSLTTSKNAATAKRIETYAKALEPVVKKLSDSGKHVYLVDMSKTLDTKTDFKDTIHPNNAGYKKIADAWYKGLEAVEKKGWIKTPVAKQGKTNTKTDKTKTHDESQSESQKKSHDQSKKVNADGSKVETSKDEKSHKNASGESDTNTEKTVTTGPNGTKTSSSAGTHDESASASDKSSKETTKKVGANGSIDTSTKTAEEAKAAEEEANTSKKNSNTVNADGSSESSSSSNDSSSKSNSESSSTSESTSSISKRSAKFRLME